MDEVRGESLGDVIVESWRSRASIRSLPTIAHDEQIKMIRLQPWYKILNAEPSFQTELSELFKSWSLEGARRFARRHHLPNERDLAWSHELWVRLKLPRARLYPGPRRFPGVDAGTTVAMAEAKGYRVVPPSIRSAHLRARVARRLHLYLAGWSWERISRSEGTPYAPGIVIRAPDEKTVKRSVRRLAKAIGLDSEPSAAGPTT